ncbi:zinc finger CCCH domain-containing protein 13-like isoform X1 [Macrobrachium rosenbergii]|uniref:zinc finger CCCH domain-containing protein 13-like isoform X1 n=1 Tax=Macrobrachium rosenbergii TaxID=79674 RepID=UPI0034D5E632
MPMVRPPPSGAPEPRSHARVARTESLKSERSDKRVSFNKDVGVKHIPRGQKTQQSSSSSSSSKNNLIRAAATPPPDEWAKCSEVYREPVNLSSQELEKQAQEIVKLLDHINCDSAPNSLAFNTRSLDRPSKKNNNKNTSHHNYNNVVFNNNVRNNKNTNVLNGEPRGRPRTLPTSRTANPINRKVKGDVNRVQSPSPIPNGGPLAHHRHRSVDHLPDTDLDTPPLSRRAHHLAGHKSVPDLNTVYYDNRDTNDYKYKQEPGVGYKSVDNLYDGDEPDTVISFGNSKAGYKSVDNLTEGNQLSSRRLQGFKSVGHLPSVALSDTDTAEMTHHEPYRPKVGNIIKKFNAEAEGVRRGTHMMDMGTEMEPGHRGTLEPDRYRSHNNNQPFSYTGTAPLASVQAVRRLSPPRDLPRPSPPRESPARDLPVYAQVSKRDGRAQTNGRREMDRNYRNTRQEREYSAKIIITDSDHRPPYQDYDDHSPYRDTSPKNNYQDEDDDAYESYQVPEDNLRRLLHDDLMPQRMLSSEDLLDEYKELSNNNINMSSVGVQTDALPKAPSRSRKTSKSPAPSPTRQIPSQVQKQSMQRQQQNHHHMKKQEFSHHQNVRSDYSVNHHSGSTIHNNLTSASLVRQVNHGFGRTDRSPSPPPRVSATRQPRRNVVPLLSDTSDSEAEHRRQPFDPLARIRDQVMQREKLQEEEEEEEEARHGRIIKDSSVMPYKAEEMTPLTIDEVDALSLIMEDTGRKKLVVSNQAQSNTVTRVSNHHSRRSETITEQHHSHSSKDSLSRPQKPPREKNHMPRESTPTRKEPSTLEKNKKNNIEKERANKVAKQKEEKKEKKKKRIKIKFFYDPRPQDDPSVDPLARFTEFRGSSSEERNSPRDEREDRRDRKEEIKDEYHNERVTTQREEYHSDRRERDDYSRHRRGLPDVLEHEDTTDGLQERRSASRERLDTTPRPNKRGSRETRDSKSSREQSHESLNSYNNKRRDSKDSRDSRDNRTRESRSRSRDDRVSYDESADERRNYEHNERSVDRDYSDNDERGSPDGRPGRSLSDKYRSGPLYDPPEEENSPSPEIPVTEEDEKQQKIMRQRKKFFSVLRSDGRSSSPPKAVPPKSKTTAQPSPVRSNKKGPAPTHPPPASSPSGEKAKEKTPAKKKPPKKKRAWPWALLGLRGGGRGQSHGSQAGGPASGKAAVSPSRVSSRASSRASSRSSHRPRRPSVRASKIHREGPPVWFNREREEADEGSPPPSQQWESSTLNRAELRARKDTRQGDSRGYSTTQRTTTARKYSAESSASSGAPPPQRVARTTSFKHRYFGDTDIESNRGGVNAVPDYRSLPNRASRSAHKNAGKSRRTATGPRGMSPPVVGSAGSSLQSSESEVDSHGGSHASRASKASHVSTGSNRSVYLHATAVADIPVRRGPDETPSERAMSRQTKKVSKSFSMLAPWKPRHYRERYEVDYENHEAHDNKGEANNSKGALPPRPPRRQANDSHDKKVNRSQSMYKDSRLAGWLRRRRNKEAKGI